MNRTLFVLSLALMASVTEAQVADVDLLRVTPAQLVVSSAISPGLSGPSRMIDARDDTAWCSRTGDLVGAWVLLDIPTDATVSEIRLTPGFVTNDHGISEWERNHRITRVAISRDGVSLGEHELDPTRPTLQSIPIAQSGGRYRIEVRATLAGSVRSYREACIGQLEVLGRPGATTSSTGAEARVATLRGNGTSARLPAHGAARTTSYAQTDAYGAHSIGDLAAQDDDASRADAAFIDLVQQAHVSRVRVHRLVSRGPARGDHVLYAYYYLSQYEETRITERMARRARGSMRQEGCEDDEGALECPTLRLARISVPAHDVPVVDADVELGSDVCGDELHTLVRDLDADDVDELRVSLEWQTHPVCPIGYSTRSTELILDEQTLREELSGTPVHRFGSEGIDETTEVRRALDLNGDGHPDFEVRTSTRTMDAEGAPTRPVITTQRFLYDVASDAWRADPP